MNKLSRQSSSLKEAGRNLFSSRPPGEELETILGAPVEAKEPPPERRPEPQPEPAPKEDPSLLGLLGETEELRKITVTVTEAQWRELHLAAAELKLARGGGRADASAIVRALLEPWRKARIAKRRDPR